MKHNALAIKFMDLIMGMLGVLKHYWKQNPSLCTDEVMDLNSKNLGSKETILIKGLVQNSNQEVENQGGGGRHIHIWIK